MAILCYCGRPGAGKSYEVVKNVILPALKDGRRVVSNIDGLNNEKFRAYIKDNTDLFDEQIGEVVTFSREILRQSHFYPVSQDDPYSFVRPGDLVVVDEAQNFYAPFMKLSEEEKIFFREHRHFCDATGRGCDLVLLSQRFQDIQQFVRGVVETVFFMRQLKFLGTKNVYTVTAYEVNQNGYPADRLSFKTHRYQDYVFKLYSSTAVEGGYQATVDNRQAVFLKRVAFMGFCIFACFFLYNLTFSLLGGDKVKKIKEQKKQQVNFVRATPTASLSARTSDNISKDWRIAGVVRYSGVRYIVLQNKDGNFRLEHPQGFTGKGGAMFGKINGSIVSYWSGDFEDEKGLGL